MTVQIDLTGRNALVTGSTRGIGRAIAGTLADCGARVAVVGRDLERAKAVAAEIGRGAEGFAADVGEVASVVKLVADVETAFGGIDILVNNAGLTRDNLMMRIKDDDWDAVIDANLRGAFVATRAATRGMMKRRWGRVINITSIVGITGNKGQANYAASKAGLIGLTRDLAQQWTGRKGIRVNAIAPGFFHSEMTEQFQPGYLESLHQRVVLGRTGDPTELAASLVWLVSPAGGYVTGQTLVVDGGFTIS